MPGRSAAICSAGPRGLHGGSAAPSRSSRTSSELDKHLDGLAEPFKFAYLCVSAPDDEERDRDQGGREGHEDSGLDELERPEPVAGLVGRERSVAEVRHARECGAYLSRNLLA
jgi:hypothetical protein